MGIWIRNQDKCKLVRCSELFIDGSYRSDYSVEGYGGDEISITLGMYSSKEKAIKVLDMIQDFIINNERTFGNVAYEEEWSGEIVTRSNNVFQMPQDEEVVEDYV